MDAFMQEAITEARKGLAEDGIPIGSVLVCGEKSSAVDITGAYRKTTR